MRRLKLYGHDISDPRFRCFGCCHVRTGTVCLGFYHLMIQVLAISAVLFAINRPEMFWDDDSKVEIKSDIKSLTNFGIQINQSDKNSTPLPELPTPQPQKFAESVPDDGRSSFYSKSDMMSFTRKRLQNGDAHLALALLVGLFFITAMLLHGVAKSRPGYLLPFFCFQVFDLMLSCLTAVGHYTWLPNIQEILNENPDLPFRNQLSDINGQWMALCILTAYVLVLFIKAYFIGVVWACYQFLHLRQISVLTYTMNENGRREDGELLLPPNYEDAMKMPRGSPPPPYPA